MIPDVEHVTYYVDGEAQEPGFHREKSAVEIAAVPDAWYALTGDATWARSFAAGRT